MSEDAEQPADATAEFDPPITSIKSVSFEVQEGTIEGPLQNNEKEESFRCVEEDKAEANDVSHFPIHNGEIGGECSGEDGMNKRVSVDIRHNDEAGAMSGLDRWRTKFGNICCMGRMKPKINSENEDKADEEDGKQKKMQYRVVKSKHRNSRWAKFFSCIVDIICVGETGRAVASNRGKSPMDPSFLLIHYLNWIFRSSFSVVFLLSLVFYLLCILFFTGLLIAAAQWDEDCISILGSPFGSENEFTDAFSLAWTTFSTVGYGNTATQVSNSIDDLPKCTLATFFAASCSFAGILYAGFCGAIFFSKVSVIQSRARVLFSDPMVIRYGTSSNDFVESDDESDDEEGTAGDETRSKIPCPALEFRVVNLLHSQVGGEIMDATLSCTASINADDVDSAIENAVTCGSAGTSMTKKKQNDFQGWIKQPRLKMRTIHLLSEQLNGHIEVDEDPSSSLSVRRVFSNVMIEASDHPFFKRVWVARHILDETSPLLTPKARKQIKRNGGFWPDHLNNHKGVRRSIKFNQIIVSLNGVSNISGSNVYAQKVYDFVDVNVGYQFVSILYKGKDDVLGVDTSLINDVKEQKGGGGEPMSIS